MYGFKYILLKIKETGCGINHNTPSFISYRYGLSYKGRKYLVMSEYNAPSSLWLWRKFSLGMVELTIWLYHGKLTLWSAQATDSWFWLICWWFRMHMWLIHIFSGICVIENVNIYLTSTSQIRDFFHPSNIPWAELFHMISANCDQTATYAYLLQ